MIRAEQAAGVIPNHVPEDFKPLGIKAYATRRNKQKRCWMQCTWNLGRLLAYEFLVARLYKIANVQPLRE